MPSMTLTKNPSLSDTINAMRAKSIEARKTLRGLAEQICAKIESGSYNDEIMALYCWVRQNVAYRKDIVDVEYVRAPQRLIDDVKRNGQAQGDCDDMACLLASLCMTLGHEARFVVLSLDGGGPNHVVCQVCVRGGAGHGGASSGERLWVTLDPVADENTARMHTRVTNAQVFGI